VKILGWARPHRGPCPIARRHSGPHATQVWIARARRIPVWALAFAGRHRFNAAVQWNKVALIGVGLLGGSLGLALRRRQLAGSVHGLVRRETSITEALACEAVDAATLDPREAVVDADLVVLCTPIAQMRPLTDLILPHLSPGALVTDVGSVKASVVRNLESPVQEGGGHFVGSHPMAGSERTGVAESKADLFVGAPCVVTDTEASDPGAVERVEALWQSVGGCPLRMDPDRHDELVARVSHAPHVMAAVMARYALNPEFPAAQSRLGATGFRDTTRVASGSPEVWRDICQANRGHLSRILEDMMGELEAFQTLLARSDSDGLMTFFAEAKQRRDDWERQWKDRGRISPAE